jgi:hypothetical protein
MPMDGSPICKCGQDDKRVMAARIIRLKPSIDGYHKIGFDQISLQINRVTLLRSSDVFERFRIVRVVAYDTANRLLTLYPRRMIRGKPTLDGGFQKGLPMRKDNDNLQIE